MRKLPIYPDNYRMPVEGLSRWCTTTGASAARCTSASTRCACLTRESRAGCSSWSTAPAMKLTGRASPSWRPTPRDSDAARGGWVQGPRRVRLGDPLLAAVRAPRQEGLEKAVTGCAPYMKRTLDVVRPTRIILMGRSRQVVLGRTVDAYAARRGVAWLGDGTPVFWLPHPKRHRNRFYRDRFCHDLKWAVTVDLSTLPRPPLDEFCRVVESREDAGAAAAACRSAGGFAFDVETCGVIFDTYWRVLCTATVPIGRDVAWVWPREGTRNPAVFEI